jgi:hypothetical protein
MKTYKELELEAYMSGDIQLAKLYANIEDVERELQEYDEDLVWREYGGT